MERFGIFELLDALSSTPPYSNADGPADHAAEKDGAPAAPAGEAAGGLAGNRASGKRTDSSVNEAPASGTAPAGGAAEGTGGNSDKGGNSVPSPAPQALESFLKRHDAVSKKVDKKK